MLWKKSWVAGVVLCIILSFAGCKMFEVESPRPLEYQTDAAEGIVSDDKVETIVGAQTDKQEKIKAVAMAAFAALGGKKVVTNEKGVVGVTDEREEVTVTEELAAAISNISANAFQAIEDADGMTDVLGGIMRRTNKDILTMNPFAYAAYTQAQGAVALDNREKLYKGIETVKGLATSTLGMIAGGTLGGGGSIAFALKMLGIARRRGTLLKATGATIEKFAAGNPVSAAPLKSELAKVAATLPIDAKKEFDI